jgi:dephospho-CoA kinase
MPKIIGLTGGIGSGKSRVVALFKTLGVPCYIADVEAKRLMNNQPEVKAAIVDLFGEQAYVDGSLNRNYLGQIVFAKPEKLKALNAIVHPSVAKDFSVWVEQQKAPFVIKEVAILFETGGYKNVDKTVLITAPETIRIERVMLRDGVSAEEVKARMRNQWTDAQREPLADFVIDNSNWEETAEEVKKLYHTLSSL